MPNIENFKFDLKVADAENDKTKIDDYFTSKGINAVSDRKDILWKHMGTLALYPSGGKVTDDVIYGMLKEVFLDGDWRFSSIENMKIFEQL
ncbi:hypothetical protein FACS1894188_03200 [Clostridia bacterium]|nr:hypothetical protein FACS1894188_03200 [Clostridia bacterium]